MLGTDERMVELARLFLGEDEDPAGAVGEALERGASLSSAPRAAPAGHGPAEGVQWPGAGRKTSRVADITAVGTRSGASGSAGSVPPGGSLAGLVAEILGSRLPFRVTTFEGIAVGPDRASATLHVRSPEALVRALQRPGQLGLARAFVFGDIDLEGDLVEAIHLASRLDGVRLSPGQWVRLARLAGVDVLRPRRPPPEEIRLSGRVHSPARDRTAVSHHYDVSDDFYRLLLGPSMTYSCALFRSPDDSLEEAQAAKHDLVARKLSLEPGMRLLDVGSGWGGMIEHAVAHYGVKAVGVTLSEHQSGSSRRRLAGVGDVDIRLQDYRQVDDGPFDAICSIGMSEHVGQDQLPAYFSKLFSLLKPGGRLLNHAISALPHWRKPGSWPSPLGLRRRSLGRFSSGSFIGRYIFPDGELVEVGVVVSAMQRAGLEVRHVESLREHYGLTLRRWLANLEQNWEAAVGLVGERRARAWRLYLAGSAFSFESGRIAVHQVLAARPEAGRSGMPLRPRFEGAG